MKTKKKSAVKTGSMLTFSINETMLYNPCVLNVAAQMEQKQNYRREYISDVVDKAVKERKKIKDITSYSKKIEKLSQLARARTADEPILTEEEVKQGHKGVLLSQCEFDRDMVDMSEVECLVVVFLDVRERLYFQMGIDIFRQIQLTFMGDTFSAKLLELEAYEDNELKELLEDIRRTPGILSRLVEILA